MSYAVSGLVREFRAPGYDPAQPMVPHGMSVVLNAPSVYRWTAAAAPERHLLGAQALGAETRDATQADAGEVLAQRIIELMRAVGFPSGLAAIGYGTGDIDALTAGTLPQQRVLANAPRPVGRDELAALFAGALRYW
jgi:alcohol dehydrogenase class IV